MYDGRSAGNLHSGQQGIDKVFGARGWGENDSGDNPPPLRVSSVVVWRMDSCDRLVFCISTASSNFLTGADGKVQILWVE